jgi:tRNA U34 5-methylaminomethyl-2-thiouridine-forming methyltransferase MnmC
MQNSVVFTPQLTADGSFTFFSAEFGESFHSNQGARLEAELKFVGPLQLRSKAVRGKLVLLDVCYGLGYNTAAALEAIWEVNPHCQVELVALELDAAVPQAAIAHHLLKNWRYPVPELLETLLSDRELQNDQIQAKLLLGDARKTLQQIQKLRFKADAIFLDPFSPPHCPQLWTVEFLELLANCLKSDGLLATYSCSAAVRNALIAVGLQIGSTVPVGRRSPGTAASFSGDNLSGISESEREHLETKAGIPYRDRTLSDPAEIILQRRQQEQQISPKESSSQWRKRWTHLGNKLPG